MDVRMRTEQVHSSRAFDDVDDDDEDIELDSDDDDGGGGGYSNSEDEDADSFDLNLYDDNDEDDEEEEGEDSGPDLEDISDQDSDQDSDQGSDLESDLETINPGASASTGGSTATATALLATPPAFPLPLHPYPSLSSHLRQAATSTSTRTTTTTTTSTTSSSAATLDTLTDASFLSTTSTSVTSPPQNPRQSLRSFSSSETLHSISAAEKRQLLEALMRDSHLDDALHDDTSSFFLPPDQGLKKRRASTTTTTKSIRSSKSSSSLKKKKEKAPKKPPVPLSTIAYNIFLLLLKLLLFIYKTLLLVSNKIASSDLVVNTIKPYLHKKVVTPFQDAKTATIAYIFLKYTQARNLTWEDVKTWYAEMRVWAAKVYKDLTTPKPKPPPPPPPPPKPPGKPFAVVWKEFRDDMDKRIEAIKATQGYIYMVRILKICVRVGSQAVVWVWIQTAPLRTSRFAAGCWSCLVYLVRLTRDVVGIVKKSDGYKSFMATIEKGWKGVVDKVVRLLVSVTPLALIGYSLQLSSAKTSLDLLVSESHQLYPSADATAIESEVVWTIRLHAALYIFLTLAFVGVNVWVYLPLLNNMKQLQAMNFTEKYNLVLSPYQSIPQKAVTLLVLVLSLATTVLFHISLITIDDTVTNLQSQPSWTLLNTTLPSIPYSEMTFLLETTKKAQTPTGVLWRRRHHPSSSMLSTICPLEIHVDDSLTTGSLQCTRRTSTLVTTPHGRRGTLCTCPVQEIQTCRLVKSTETPTSEIAIYTVALDCISPTTRNLHVLPKRGAGGARQAAITGALPPQNMGRLFDPTWIPEPAVVIPSFGVSRPLGIDRVVHIGKRYETVSVQFTRPVVGTAGGGSGGEPYVLPTVKVNAVKDGKIVKKGLVARQSDSVMNMTSNWDTFRVLLNETELASLSGPLALHIEPKECFEMYKPHRACDTGKVGVVQVPVLKLDYSVSLMRGDGLEVSEVKENIFSVWVEFAAAVGVISKKSSIGLVKPLAEFGFAVELVDGKKAGAATKSVAVVKVTEEEGWEKGRFRRYRLDLLIPKHLGKDGSLKVSVLSGVVRREWPRLAVDQSPRSVDIARGMCCRASFGSPTLHPTACKPGYQFISGEVCKGGAARPPVVPPKAILGTQPLVATTAPAFLGGYTTDSSLPSFEAGLQCPSSSLKLQTYITPPLNLTSPEPGLYTIHQACLQFPTEGAPPTSLSITRFLHLKPSPPTPHIVSITRSVASPNNSIHLQFTFSTAIRNTSIPVSALQVFHLRQNTVLSPVTIHMDEFDAYDGKEWSLEVKTDTTSHSEAERFLEGDEIRLRVSSGAADESLSSVAAASSGSGGFFSWIFGSSTASDEQVPKEWSCTDATPPYEKCVASEGVAFIGDSGKIVGVEFGGMGVDDASSVLKVRFSQAVEPRMNGIWSPTDVLLGIGQSGATAGISLIPVLNVLDTMDDHVLTVVINMSVKELQAKAKTGSVVHVSVEEGKVVGVVGGGKGRSYVSATAFSINVTDLMQAAPRTGTHVPSSSGAQNSSSESISILTILALIMGASVTFFVGLIVVAVKFGGAIEYDGVDILSSYQS
ncbi:hypothetical protein HDU79_002319 [Rhizoclosmatium sp. JEL0117]|nr:hypothetical protein HDU79_002319 [Rhizoclosmatium sp. JEL0117]